MGNITSQTTDDINEIINFKNVNIPNNYTMVKIVTYNVQLKNSINIDNHIHKIGQYILGTFRDKDIDIMCIQGLDDKYSLYKLITHIKTMGKNNDINLYFAPEFDNINVSEQNSLQSSLNIAWSDSKQKSDKGASDNILNNNTTPNIIISRHMIISYLCEPLDTPETSLFVIDGIVSSNININNNIISIYNISLSNDIISAQINNSEKRKCEMNKVKDIIVSNHSLISTDDRFRKYKKTDINFMVGSFEIVETKNNEINEEYLELTSKFRCADIYRYQHEEKEGYTNIKNERSDYIMLLLTEDIFDNKGKYHKMILNIKNPEDAFKLIFDRYNLHTIQTHVNIDETCRPHFPIENIMIFKTSNSAHSPQN